MPKFNKEDIRPTLYTQKFMLEEHNHNKANDIINSYAHIHETAPTLSAMIKEYTDMENDLKQIGMDTTTITSTMGKHDYTVTIILQKLKQCVSKEQDLKIFILTLLKSGQNDDSEIKNLLLRNKMLFIPRVKLTPKGKDLREALADNLIKEANLIASRL